TGAADEIGTFVWCFRALRGTRYAQHLECVQGLGLDRRPDMGARAGRNDLELVVIVPGAGHADVEQCRCDTLVPPPACLGLREAEISADSIPELYPLRLAVRVGSQQAFVTRFGEEWVVVQQRGLDVGDEADALFGVGTNEALGIGEFILVPM